MKRFTLALLCLLLFPLLGLATEEKPAIGITEAYPKVGETVKLFVSHASHPLETFDVTVTYRPNSTVSKTINLGKADNNGYLEWTPKDAGITVIKAVAPKVDGKKITVKKHVSVRYGHFPPMGIFIFVLAAMTLFGGLLVTVSKMGSPPQPS